MRWSRHKNLALSCHFFITLLSVIINQHDDLASRSHWLGYIDFFWTVFQSRSSTAAPARLVFQAIRETLRSHVIRSCFEVLMFSIRRLLQLLPKIYEKRNTVSIRFVISSWQSLIWVAVKRTQALIIENPFAIIYIIYYLSLTAISFTDKAIRTF